MYVAEKPYSLKGVIWCTLCLFAFVAAMKVTSGAGFLLILFPMLIGFGKNKAPVLFFVLLATASLTVTNGLLAPKGFVFSVAARVVYLITAGVAFLQVVGRKGPRQTVPLLGIMVYLAYEALVSAVGYQPIISYMKLILFTSVFVAFYGISTSVLLRTRGNAERAMRTVVLAVSCYFILGSVALIPFPGYGKMGAFQAAQMGLPVDAVGLFQGMTFQPQTLGPLVGLLAALLLADLLFSIRRWDPLYLALLVAAPVLVYYTSSRTAMGTWLVGMSFTSFVFMCVKGRDMLASKWKSRAISTLMLVGLLVGAGLFVTPGIRDKALSFIFKTDAARLDESDFTFDAFTHSRQGLVEGSMEGFRESPMIGNGFQVVKGMEDLDVRSWKQLLSAPIEKGVWVYAVLEEGGVFGFLIFSLYLIIAMVQLLCRGAYIGASTLMVFVVSNLGEFTIFSMSANGGIMWALTFAGATLDAFRVRRETMAGAYGMRPLGAPPPVFNPYSAVPPGLRRMFPGVTSHES